MRTTPRLQAIKGKFEKITRIAGACFCIVVVIGYFTKSSGRMDDRLAGVNEDIERLVKANGNMRGFLARELAGTSTGAGASPDRNRPEEPDMASLRLESGWRSHAALRNDWNEMAEKVVGEVLSGRPREAWEHYNRIGEYVYSALMLDLEARRAACRNESDSRRRTVALVLDGIVAGCAAIVVAASVWFWSARRRSGAQKGEGVFSEGVADNG